MGLKRTSNVAWVSDRTLLAHRAGIRLAVDFKTVEQAIAAVVLTTDAWLNDSERLAYAQLLPATWWAHFRRGFAAGRLVVNGG